MKTILKLGLLALSFTFFAFSSGFVGNWNISDDYSIRFSGTGAEGTFSGLNGTINFSEENLAIANMDVSVAVNTISTGNTTKDKHARGDSWFDAEKHPRIKFRSESFRKTSSGYSVKGTLTLHGVTKTVDIPFTFAKTTDGGLFKGSFTIDRQDYGIEGPWLAFTVGDEFKIDLKVPVK